MKKKEYVNEFGEVIRDVAVVMLDGITGGVLSSIAADMYKEKGVEYEIDHKEGLIKAPRLRVIWFDNEEYNKWTY